MTAMAEKLSEAGLDTIRAKLDRVACEELRKAKQNIAIALPRFLKILRPPGAELMEALVGKTVVECQAEAYLRQHADDMRPTRDVGCQNVGESHEASDHHVPAPTNSRSSQTLTDSQADHDRPAPTRGGVSQFHSASHHNDDRPSPPSTKISKLAATRVAKSSIYDMRIGLELTFRTAKLYDIINNERAGSRYTRVMTLLRIRKMWPDDAAVPDVYSEKELRAIIKEADKAVPPLPTEAFTHGR